MGALFEQTTESYNGFNIQRPWEGGEARAPENTPVWMARRLPGEPAFNKHWKSNRQKGWAGSVDKHIDRAGEGTWAAHGAGAPRNAE